jgi:putative SOS response-associated peptidase YedK
MVDIHDRRPVALETEDAWRWMDLEIPAEEASHIAHSRSLPTEEFVWWKVDRGVNRADPSNNGKHLLTPISETT